MRVIFVNAFKTPNPLMWITAIWTRGKYSHCEFLFDDEKMFGASFTEGKCRFDDAHIEDHKSFEVHTINTTPEEEQKVREFCEKYDGREYDYAGLFGFVFRSNSFDSRRRAFCSEIMSEGLTQCTKFSVSKKPHRMSPVRLHRDLNPCFITDEYCEED